MDGQTAAQLEQAETESVETLDLVPDDIAAKIRNAIHRMHEITQVIGTHHSTNTDLALLDERLHKIDTFIREMEKIAARIVTTGPGE